MKVTDLFTPELTRFCKSGVTNKKKSLEKISKLINAYNGDIKYQHILDSLQQREKIGNTALGHSVAIPHARVADLARPYCVVLVLENPINFSPTEEKLVDLVFGLVVPATYVEEHLQLLAKITEKLHQEVTREPLRHCKKSDDLYQQLIRTYENS